MSRNTIKLNTSNLLVIAHGKNEYEIFEYIFQAIEKPKYIYARKQGKQFHSIQITSLRNLLYKAPFDTFKHFINKYGSLEIKNGKIQDFKVAIVMDTDDCTSEDKENFLNKEMFRGHWLFEYIWPIHNTMNLEDVLKKSEINYPGSKKRNYSSIFVQRGCTQKDSIKSIIEKLSKYNQKTNMHEVFQYRLDK